MTRQAFRLGTAFPERAPFGVYGALRTDDDRFITIVIVFPWLPRFLFAHRAFLLEKREHILSLL
ncbi:hypothetical protein BBI15_15675 [Planococcus plakortidis]|uniref:Uncharacterized protein n=1 Tax=Planococcus plakortidis TaxID=1038856 RepID=A0A1C7ECU4_9BACL|nr:hypothetical protein BBI15_15675 [Planococcus plakortidis]